MYPPAPMGLIRIVAETCGAAAERACTRSMGRRLPAGLAAAASAATMAGPLAAQDYNSSASRYEMQCGGGGSVVDVSLYDLGNSAVSYDQRVIRLKGRLEINVDPSVGGRAGRSYVLRDMS